MKSWILVPAVALTLGATPPHSVAAEKCDSPDGRLNAWVEPTPKILIATGAGDTEATELWVQDTLSGNRRLVLRGHDAREMREVIAGIRELRFSSDGSRLFFSSDAWATSSAVHAIDLRSNRVSFVSDGSLKNVVRRGRYAGCLLIERALIKSDSHGKPLGRDIYAWLFTCDGFPVLEIGPSDAVTTERFIREQLGTAVPASNR